MRLERIRLYYLVRALRVVLPLLILTLVSILAWTYFNRTSSEPPAEIGMRLSDNVLNETEGLTLFYREDCFTLEAALNLGFEGGLNQFESVEVVLGGCDGSPERRIRGALCGVREEGATVIRCEGSVEVELDSRTKARTESLRYDSASETVSTEVPAQIVRDGQFRITADAMSVQLRERLFHLEGRVRIDRPDNSRIEAGEVWYDETANLVTGAGNLRLTSARLSLESRRGQVWLEPGTYELSRIEVRGNVEALSPDAEGPRRMSAREMDIEFMGGVATGISARGTVALESGARRLAGDTIVARLGSTGAPESVESTGDARMTLDSGETIRSERIVQREDGAVLTAGASELEAAGTTVRGSDFTIDQNAGAVFSTDRFASIHSPQGLFEGGATRASFDSEAGTLERLEQTGSVRFEADGRRGSADRIVIDEQRIELEGHARVEDEGSVLESQTVVMNRLDDSFEAGGGVFLRTSGESGPVFIEGERLVRSASPMFRVSGSVVLRQDGRQVDADRVDFEPDGRAFVAEGDVRSVMDDIMVSSDFLDFDDGRGRIEYSGRVSARTEELAVDSELLEVLLTGGEIDRIEATGDVRVTSHDGFEGSGRSAVYRRRESLLTIGGPGAEAVDAATGRCIGEEIVVDLRTRDVRVRGTNGRLATCSSLSAPATSGDDE